MAVSRAEANTTPEPRQPVRLKAAPVEAAPKMAGDQLVKQPKKPIGDAKVDKLTDGLGAQGFVQDTTRFLAKWLSSAGRESRLANSLMGFFAGDAADVERGVGAAVGKVGQAARVVGPQRAAVVARAASPVSKAASATLRFVGKAGPLISIPFAGYDVLKAWTEPDAAKKDAAWMNASLTVGGTALGLAALAVPPLAIPLLAGSAAVAILQLGDTYLLKGKAMDWLGAHVMHPLRHLLGRS
ncbi:MAG: hypothetical protein JWM80_3856 [Cyanobacteria bacterium RYN_339]|nr:hypothetical protein [Cyanobacteria bacterium RYN_339]